MYGRRFFGMAAAIIFLASVNAAGAGRRDELRPLGYVAARGDVRIDRQPAPSGTALFPGEVITTGSESAAVMSFQSGTAATLAAASEVALTADAGITTLSLNKGTVTVRSEGPVPGRVNVLGATVLVQGQTGFPALCRIAFAGETAAIFADQGRVEIRGKGAPVVLTSGKHHRLGRGAPQAAGQPAGKVANAIPDETVQHPGQAAELPLRVADPIIWEDIVRTLKTGRVRIALLDGSFLNVGARSVMRITKHDAQTQQTEVELQLGRLRGEVVKITKPGGSVQIKTQTAVIGVVGTILNVHALRNLTRVFCLDGTVTVRNINPAIPGEVTLHPGQTTSVPRGGPPSGASTAPGSQIAEEVSQTTAGETLSGELARAMQAAGAGQGGGGAGGGLQLGSTLTNGIATGAGAASAALGGVAASRAGDAKDTAGRARITAGEAVDAAEAAAQAARDAAGTASNVSDGVETLIESLSPGGTGCGCVP
jgi:ferric-dicitrate binding protein FerR (iron transport regulator)